jgi:hypothetical protein
MTEHPCKYVGIHSGQKKGKMAIGGTRLNVNFKTVPNASQAE